MSVAEINDGLRRRGFWEFNIGHVLMLLSLVGGFLIWWESFGSLPRETAKAVADLAVIVKDINDKGTTGSRLALSAENGRMDRLDDRITALERNYTVLDSKMSAALAKMDVIAALLEGNKGKK